MPIPHFEAAHFLKSLNANEIVEELTFLRSEKLRLSKLKVNKRAFKYLKALGVFSSFLQSSDEKKWLGFTSTEHVLIKIAETLWKYGFTAEKIKSVVDILLSDNWVLDYINQTLLNEQLTIKSLMENRVQKMTFLEYCVIEKQKTPNLRTFTNLEALLIAAFNTDIPISIVINQSGEWGVYSTLPNPYLTSFSFKETLFQNTFINITFKEILDEIFKSKHKSSCILNPNLAGTSNVEALISKGFDYKTIRDLEIDSTEIETELFELPINTNIGKLKASNANQDILVKVRNAKVTSVKQLVIKNHKN